MRRTTKRNNLPQDLDKDIEADTFPQGKEGEEEKPWPPFWVRFLLWPIADFTWRHKVEVRLATSQYTLVEMLSIEPALSIQPVPGLPLFLLPDGSIRFEEPQFQSPDRTKREKHSVPFTIHLSEELMEDDRVRRNLPPMKRPIVSSDGRYVKTYRRRDDQLDKVFTFWEGLWFRWQANEKEPSYPSILQAGLENYQELGNTFLVRTLIAAIILLFIIMELTPGVIP